MNLEQIIAKHDAAIKQVRSQLATNYETPAQRIINRGMNAMGLNRFDRSGNDLWEQIICFQDGEKYEKPPAHLVARWAAY